MSAAGLLAGLVGLVVWAYFATLAVLAVTSVVIYALYRITPCYCTRCKAPLLRDHTYCPVCHYSTVEDRYSLVGGDDR